MLQDWRLEFVAGNIPGAPGNIPATDPKSNVAMESRGFAIYS
jgi:hypothetical protein